LLGLWIVCILVSGSLCAVLLKNNINDFFAFGVETVVQIQHDNKAEFPTVTLCTVNVCKMPDYSVKDMLIAYYKQVKENCSAANFTDDALPNDLQIVDCLLNQTDPKQLNKYAKKTYIETLKADPDKNQSLNLNVNLESILITCMYNSEFCYATDFEPFKLTEFQSCFKYNGRRLLENDTFSKIKEARRYGKIL
jgi:hypothetical protein